MRTALGASRSRVIRQLLTENLTLAMAGAGGGLVFARWGSDLLKYALPAGLAAELPVLMQFHVDGRVFERNIHESIRALAGWLHLDLRDHARTFSRTAV